jgi:hypothetical protein
MNIRQEYCMQNASNDAPVLCRQCHTVLFLAEPACEGVAFLQCQSCGQRYPEFEVGWLPTDEETSLLFVSAVAHLLGTYSAEHASNLARQYYVSFTNETYCARIGIPLQDDDFFHHEGAREIALRIHYYLGIGGNPDPHSYIKWRTGHQSRLG